MTNQCAVCNNNNSEANAWEDRGDRPGRRSTFAAAPGYAASRPGRAHRWSSPLALALAGLPLLIRVPSRAARTPWPPRPLPPNSVVVSYNQSHHHPYQTYSNEKQVKKIWRSWASFMNVNLGEAGLVPERCRCRRHGWGLGAHSTGSGRAAQSAALELWCRATTKARWANSVQIRPSWSKAGPTKKIEASKAHVAYLFSYCMSSSLDLLDY
jgi:hypothetical protein